MMMILLLSIPFPQHNSNTSILNCGIGSELLLGEYDDGFTDGNICNDWFY